MAVRTILFVGASQGDALLFASTLRRRDPGFQLRHFGSARRAFEFLSARGQFAADPKPLRPDLVVLDPPAPGPAGLALLRWLKRQPAFRALPVIVLTAGGRIEEERAAMKRGATTYVSRSYDWAPLLDNVQYIFSKTSDD